MFLITESQTEVTGTEITPHQCDDKYQKLLKY